MRILPILLLCLVSCSIGGLPPLAIANMMQSEKRAALAALKNFTVASDRRDAAHRNQLDAQERLIAEMRKGIDVRNRLLELKEAR